MRRPAPYPWRVRQLPCPPGWAAPGASALQTPDSIVRQLPSQTPPPPGLHPTTRDVVAPAMSRRMQASFLSVNRSASSHTLSRKVKREEAEESTVLEVTEVCASERLNVYCARYHSGATCRGQRPGGRMGGRVGMWQDQSTCVHHA